VIGLRLRRSDPWWPAVVALVAITAALGASLLIPHLFSDPNGVDPYVARLSATALVLAAATFIVPSLASARPVALAVFAVTGSFTLLSAGPQILFDLFGARSGSGDEQLLLASAAQLAVTVAIAALVWRAVPKDRRPTLRLRRFGAAALVVSVAGVAVLVLVGLAVPASWLGRDGLQPVEIVRDAPWLVPANALQALAQELQFRGLLMGALERVMPVGWANLAQAAFFGLSHLAVNYEGPVGPFVPVTIAIGLLFGYAVQRTRSLWPAVVVHAAADVAITFVVLPGLYGF
jgi:membrane protease YdiL (CAAX protease family)